MSTYNTIIANKLIDRLNELTTNPVLQLKHLSDLSEDIIADLVYAKNKSDDENIIEVDIGIGFLFVYWDDDEVKYRFRPSTGLGNKIKQKCRREDTQQS